MRQVQLCGVTCALSSTCCPRWTVGCTVGSVGCCDPAKPWQTTTAATSRTNTRRSRATRHKSAVQAREDVPEEFDSRHRKRPSSGVNFTGYALFPIDSMVTTRMDAFTFDALTGEVLAKNPATTASRRACSPSTRTIGASISPSSTMPPLVLAARPRRRRSSSSPSTRPQAPRRWLT